MDMDAVGTDVDRSDMGTSWPRQDWAYLWDCVDTRSGNEPDQVPKPALLDAEPGFSLTAAGVGGDSTSGGSSRSDVNASCVHPTRPPTAPGPGPTHDSHCLDAALALACAAPADHEGSGPDWDMMCDMLNELEGDCSDVDMDDTPGPFGFDAPTDEFETPLLGVAAPVRAERPGPALATDVRPRCNFPGCTSRTVPYRVPVELLCGSGKLPKHSTCKNHWTWLRRCTGLDASDAHRACAARPSAKCEEKLHRWDQAFPGDVAFHPCVWERHPPCDGEVVHAHAHAHV